MIICFASLSASYSHWEEKLEINADMTTGVWDTGICIMKTLEGSYTDPNTGNTLTIPTNEIRIGASFPTTFKLTIDVENLEPTNLINVQVTDTIGSQLTPTSTSPSKGTVTWIGNDLTWNINTLDPLETAGLIIWLETIYNTQEEKYEPICDNGGNGYLIPIDPLDGDTYIGDFKSYEVECPTKDPFDPIQSIKYETSEDEDGVKNGGYDIFEFTLPYDPGVYPIQIQAKSAWYDGQVTLYNPGDTGTDDGHVFEFLSKTVNGDGTVTYQFKVTNNNDKGLSHVSISLPPADCCPMLINNGASIYAEAGDNVWCEDPLEATTTSLSFNICNIQDDIGIITPGLPISTNWAQDSCTH